MQKYGKLMETRLYELEHESKMRLLKTHPHTSERQGYEADKARQQKREAKEAYPQGTRKTSTTKTTAISPARGCGTRMCRRNAKNRSSATTNRSEGGRTEIRSPKKEIPDNQIPRSPPAPSEWAGRKRK